LISRAAGKFFDFFLASFHRRALPPQISGSSRAPVAQLDRASDFHSFSWRRVCLATEGKFRFSHFQVLRAFVKFQAATVNKP
jgi:hypothetical protein